eukprot:TRINITY_DN35107_c0_g1_i1.p1 TRINITY_DN35107_c0_g1~~TRINITY_DN35107_c0_g1_i1.p1  ORF type:complete len:227 (-),score=39.19 TRINITY_DN35107_c0_g1_i1:63-659(-)
MVALHYGANVTATDVTPVALQALTRNVARHGNGARRFLNFLNAHDEAAWRLRGTFDVVMGSSFISEEHLEKWPVTLQLLELLLKPCLESKVVILGSTVAFDFIEDWQRTRLAADAAGRLRLTRRAVVHPPIKKRSYELALFTRASLDAGADNGMRRDICRHVGANLDEACIDGLLALSTESKSVTYSELAAAGSWIPM